MTDGVWLQGGFARCYEMTCEQTGATYAGKVVAKASLLKPMAKQKVCEQYCFKVS